MSDWAIRVEHISKNFRRHPRSSRALHETIERTLRSSLHRLSAPAVIGSPSGNGNKPAPIAPALALEDISFQIQPGQFAGLIGHNGAGKSVLLKILARVTRPTIGEVLLRGRVGAVLEVGAGFHREFTGRENIYLQAAILGMKKKEIARRFDQIVAFSGIEEFLDVPLKHFSSGMGVRLAFAVAAHLDADILLMDEVLAVADESFQTACIAKLKELSREGRTILLVSHDLEMLAQLCPRTILLSRGKMIADGNTAEVAALYHREAETRHD